MHLSRHICNYICKYDEEPLEIKKINFEHSQYIKRLYLNVL